jgi:peptide/nickel transport system substrate-binding protein
MDKASFYSTFTSHTKKWSATYRTLSPEKVLTVWALSMLACILFCAALIQVNARHIISVPSYGGDIREGSIGTPRFINPVLAISEQDIDIANLVYAGLTKRDEHGAIVLDMASSIIESDDKLHYDIVLKSGVRFHDGKPVTSDDVMYTISLIQNPLIKSPHLVEWEGITVEKKSATELSMSLKKPYPLFMDVLTTGILPKHIWKDLTEEQISLSDFNIHAIGSGPYRIKTITTVSGIPQSFTLVSNPNYTLGRPYINTITITSYQNERYLLQAFQSGTINRVHGISPQRISSLSLAPSEVHTSLLPRTFTVFFNPNTADFLSDKNVRAALNMAINKQAIVDTVLKGYGKVSETPFPFDEDQPASLYNREAARALLVKSKYLKTSSSTLTITLSTTNSEDMKAVAAMIQADWEAIGVRTNLAVYEVTDLNQSIIKGRDFQALLFGSITESPADLYAFWHSSQRSYPGLNISNYVSRRLDTNLETIRESDDNLARVSAYEAVKQEFTEETPGIFLFVPSLIYITRDRVTTTLPTYALSSASRFDLVTSWYRYTEKIWPQTYYKKVIATLENIIH